jgi:hypothetical protein
LKIQLYIFVILWLTLLNASEAQVKRDVFFNYTQDSSKSRNANITLPIQGQTFGISNSFITDFVGSTKLSVITSLIASKNDTLRAIHSLFNGIGNLTGDVETPLWFLCLRKYKSDFLGLSFNPRFSTLINPEGNLEKSTVNFDAGLNSILSIGGDLGNIDAKIIFRNALAWGNYEFNQNIDMPDSDFYFYNSIQLNIKTFRNNIIVNVPLNLRPFNRPSIRGLPIFGGMGFRF